MGALSKHNGDFNMNKIFLIAALLASSAFQTANAYQLTFNPQTQSVVVGGNVAVDAVLSGLTSASQIVSAFDVSVDFNSSIVGFASSSLGTNFGSLASFANPTVSGSTISWNLTSAELDAALQTMQGDSVTLGTLNFSALTAGSSPLSYSYSDVTGLNSTALSPELLTGTINVTGTSPGSVPEPSILMLMSLGVLGMLTVKRRKAQALQI
jgi:hypothetical protein